MTRSIAIHVLLATATLLLLMLPQSPCLAFGTDKASLFAETAAVIDLRAPRLSLVTPAADSCPWVLLMYDSMCGHCRDFAPPFGELATALARRGFLVGAVNCAADEKICVASNVTSVPVVYVGSPKRTPALRESNDNDSERERELQHRRRRMGLPDLVRDARLHVKLEEEELAMMHTGASSSSSASVKKAAAATVGILAANMNHGWYEASAAAPGAVAELDDKTVLSNIRDSTNFIATKHGLPMELCREAAHTLMLKKRLMIEHSRHHRLGDAGADAKQTDGAGAVVVGAVPASFVPPRVEPCLTDLVGALFVALRHEVVIAPRTLQNWWALLQLLEAVHAALPQLGAGRVLALLHKDRTAPYRPTWGRVLADALGIKPPPPPPSSPLQQAEKNVHRTAAAADNNDDEEDRFSAACVEWRACRGSSPNFRGYTCGLWMLFHAVLSNSPRGAAMAALHAIREYVVNFLVCLECRVHFSQMTLPAPSGGGGGGGASLDADDRSAVLWLYRAHNGVNRRLQHTVGSTDPLVPKVQFPARDLDFCAARLAQHRGAAERHCPDSQSASDAELLQFLHTFYSWENIRACAAAGSAGGAVTAETTTAAVSLRSTASSVAFFSTQFSVLGAFMVAMMLIAAGGCIVFVLRNRHHLRKVKE